MTKITKMTKRILMIIALFITLILVNSTKAEAAFTMYWENYNHLPSGFYCVQNSQSLSAGMLMKEYMTIHINGLNSERYNGKENGVMAYILNQNDGNGSTHFSPEYYTEKQKAIYGYFGTWKNANGISFASNGGGYSSNAYVSRGEEYANSIQNVQQASITNNTNEDNIQKDFYTYNGQEYIKVGPLNWTYNDYIDSVQVYNQDNNQISVLYAKYAGNNLTASSNPKDIISSGSNFYVLVAADGSVTKINKIVGNVKVSKEIIWADVTLWQGVYGSWGAQHLISENTGTYTNESSASITTKEIPLYIKLSGYVWNDEIFGKQSLKNYLYKDNDNDSNDQAMDGITVRLKDNNGNTIQTTTTSEKGLYDNINGGEFIFEKVAIGKLNDYHIEYEYDGLTYTNVDPHIDKDNGSKGAESQEAREAFNKQFSIIEGGSSETTGVSKDGNTVTNELTYGKNRTDHSSTLINNGQYKITAQTTQTGYNLLNAYKAAGGGAELRFVNLGLYEREQPNIALVKDIQNVQVDVNNKAHVYNYSQRFDNQGEYGDGFNVGVKFGNKYGNMSYTRAIYKADYEYEYQGDSAEKDARELKVYITYKIAVKNLSTNLVSQVNSIVEYYDNRYEVMAVGTAINEKGEITENSSKPEVSNYNDEYNKFIITNSIKVEPQQTGYVYVQFKLNKAAVLNVLNSGNNLNNVAEINSYSTFDKDGKIYAGIDENSAPGNAIPGDKTTYEDDTDSAPALQLEVADARAVSGKVFIDSTTGELMTGQVRNGSGAYEDGENGLEGVEVKLKENSGSGKEYTATTNGDGDFYISGYIPGDYTISYTWGDRTYTVQNYKGTIYDSTRDQSNGKWYKENVDKRLTDAIDNYETRQLIDNEMKQITNSTQTTIEKMDSTTPTMDIGVEYENTYTASAGDKYIYQISNVDFGIVERARQDLALTKRVSTMKVTLANGQTVADITIDENGEITGQKTHLVYMAPSSTADPKNGLLKIELDNELIEGAKIEVGYEIKASNNSELDYLSENFYKYGTIGGNLVKITPSAIIDYLDNDWAFDDEINQEWQVKTLDEIKGSLAEVVYNNETSAINEKIILYTESLKEEQLEPTKSASVMLNVSKLLSNSEEISLDNETEITKVDKTGGSDLVSIPGNYVPGTGNTETDDSMSETVIVTPSTGDNQNYILLISIGIATLVILGVGVVLIKKKALKK